ncbi:ABC transporter ATP-binding protein [Kiloniella laminariae]|uniref:ABC transporter ATP-binding protein n=1 Tax=Kiloniella laminariae TaxID=454162 RepID=A0ABT4LJW8_9PROT|nr:ABC transporter ATP-binding protein [Kiloniella laminariae]MCZ4281403.1 ABC transporter ATP-binding protein [Kiloniella laminariae]
MTDSNSISLNQVSKWYPSHKAVSDVDLFVPEGCLMALVGHNGAGKTTLMKLILGLIRPTAGNLTILGKDPCDRDAFNRREGIGFLPENVSFEPNMTGRELIRFYARLKHESDKRCFELMETVGLGDAIDRRLKTYSKGMKQRLGLAQALLGKPRLLLLDEPTSGLDPAARQQFYDIIRDLRNEGVTILLCSHVLTELEAQTDAVTVMNSGRVVASGSLEQLRERAGLPLNIRVTVKEGMTEKIATPLRQHQAQITRLNGRHLELECPPQAKMQLLRHLGELGSVVEDIELFNSSLDQLYAVFSTRKGA